MCLAMTAPWSGTGVGARASTAGTPDTSQAPVAVSSSDADGSSERWVPAPDRFVAADAEIWPIIDGIVDEDEWADASIYRVLAENRVPLTFYFKTVTLSESESDPSGHCSIYPDNPSYTIPCGGYLLLAVTGDIATVIDIYFDEGDDGGYGSGSGDKVLTEGQEDLKIISGAWYSGCWEFQGRTTGCPEPQCVPWSDSDCWACNSVYEEGSGTTCSWTSSPAKRAPAVSGTHMSFLDGFFENSDWGYWAGYSAMEEDPHDTGQLVYMTWADEASSYGGPIALEMTMPFAGIDGPDHGSDTSDARFERGDVLNFVFKFMWEPTIREPRFWTPPLLTGGYPENNNCCPETWMPLQIGGNAERFPPLP